MRAALRKPSVSLPRPIGLGHITGEYMLRASPSPLATLGEISLRRTSYIRQPLGESADNRKPTKPKRR
jgi:hypothetical protein